MVCIDHSDLEHTQEIKCLNQHAQHTFLMTLTPIIQLYSVIPTEHSSSLLLSEVDCLIKRNRALEQKVRFVLSHPHLD